MDMTMEQKIISQVNEIGGEMLQGILEMVKINSTESEAEPEAPYGAGVKAALEKALELGKGLGFSTVNLDNQIGYASYGTCLLYTSDAADE